MSELLNKDYPLCCPKCGSDEVYFDNQATGSVAYTCQNCYFMGDKDEFNRIITPDELKQLQQQLADHDATIASQDRQLEAAAKDITEQGAFACNKMDNDCPKENGCTLMKYDEPYDICRELWRKRWKEIADNG